MRPASPFQPSKAGTCADEDNTYICTDKNNNSNNEDRGQYEYITLNVWSGRPLSVDNANNKYADKDNNNINEDNKDHHDEYLALNI